MKTAALFVLAASALASAQVTYNETTGVFTCDRPNVAYCAGTSLDTDIIIRCDGNGIGQPGRCVPNLSGEFPVGSNPASCYQTSETAGDALCEKNCVVYGTSSSSTLPLSLCTPYATASGTASTSASATATASGSSTVNTTSWATISPPLSTVNTLPGTGSGPAPTNNGTCYNCGSGSSADQPTKTPIQPTTKPAGSTPTPTGAAVANRVGGSLVIIGLVAAYFF